MKKNDWILAGCILLVCAGLFLFRMIGRKNEGGSVVVTVAGEEYGVYSLSEDRTVWIGDTNCLKIEKGTAEMKSADCPDQICVRHKEISHSGENIICLPNKVVVTVEGGSSGEIDAVAQ